MAQAIVFSDDPAAQASVFEEQGFSWLHVVDLDGGVDAVWARLHRGTRKYVRRAERAGVRI